MELIWYQLCNYCKALKETVYPSALQFWWVGILSSLKQTLLSIRKMLPFVNQNTKSQTNPIINQTSFFQFRTSKFNHPSNNSSHNSLRLQSECKSQVQNLLPNSTFLTSRWTLSRFWPIATSVKNEGNETSPFTTAKLLTMSPKNTHVQNGFLPITCIATDTVVWEVPRATVIDLAYVFITSLAFCAEELVEGSGHSMEKKHMRYWNDIKNF